MTRNYWFEVIGEDSELCGEEFFVSVNGNRATAEHIAAEYFPNEELKCHGWVNDEIAEQMGLDTY